MGKPESKGQVAALEAKLEASYAAIKRLEADAKKAQRRLAAKAEEVAIAKKARQEALKLLGEAAEAHPDIKDKVANLLFEDAARDAAAALAATLAERQLDLPQMEA
jgi:hypothetical protein